MNREQLGRQLTKNEPCWKIKMRKKIEQFTKEPGVHRKADILTKKYKKGRNIINLELTIKKKLQAWNRRYTKRNNH